MRFWMYFEGTANWIDCQTGFQVLEKEEKKDNSKVFGMNSWQDRLPSTEMGKVMGRAGFGVEDWGLLLDMLYVGCLIRIPGGCVEQLESSRFQERGLALEIQSFQEIDGI